MRFDRDQWLRQSLTLLITHGPDVLKVDPLCRKLGVTKGSFYHHFPSREVFVGELLKHWQQVHTQALIDALDGIDDPYLRSHALSKLVNAQNKEQELAMRGWALRDNEVAQFVSRVDGQRIECIEHILAAMTGQQDNAGLQARLIYSQWLGSVQLADHISDQQQASIESLLRTALVPS
ncbi:MAG TPA: TetR/AcrR family transcriptional regulator [Marinagarivorans sp.]